MTKYDLRNRPWIPVATIDGAPVELGLRELIVRAHELRDIRGNNPLETISLYRMAVGLVHHLLGDIRDEHSWATIFARQRFDASAVHAYFEDDRWSDGFDLFDLERPFWQVPGLTNVDRATGAERPVGVQSLLLEVAAGNTRTFFSHQSDASDFSLDAAAAARALVTAQYYRVSGTNRKHSDLFGSQQNFSHAPFVSGIVSFVVGANLFESLMLNVLPRQWRGPGLSQLEPGVPPWAESAEDARDTRRDATRGETVPRTYLELLLPRSRHIRLVPSDGGGESPVVRDIHIAQGVAWDPAVEPWFVKRRDNNQDSGPVPLPFSVERAVWRDSTAYFGWQSRDGKWGYEAPRNIQAYPTLRGALASPESLPRLIRTVAYSLANDKAKPLAWRAESLTLPLEGLTGRAFVQEIDESLRIAEDFGTALRRAVERFYREVLPPELRKPQQKKKNQKRQHWEEKALRDATVRLYWGQLEGPFRRTLSGSSTHETFRQSCEVNSREAFDRFARSAAGTDVRRYRALALAEVQFARSSKSIRGDQGVQPMEGDHA